MPGRKQPVVQPGHPPDDREEDLARVEGRDQVLGRADERLDGGVELLRGGDPGQLEQHRQRVPHLVSGPGEAPWREPLLAGDYPAPIVNHAERRAEALARFKAVREAP